MKDQYGRTIEEPRKPDFKTPERGVNKKAIRLMTILLFLTAAIIFVYPSGNKSDDAPANNNTMNIENIEDTGEHATINENMQSGGDSLETPANGTVPEQALTSGGIKD